MSGEDVIYVAFNEPRTGRFVPYIESTPHEGNYCVPRALWPWESDEAELEGFNGPKAGHLESLRALLGHVQGAAAADADVRSFDLDQEGIFW